MPVQLDDDVAGQFARMGATVEVTDAPPTPDGFEVLRINADALTAWLACETQWRVVVTPGSLIWLGLDYRSVDVVLRRIPTADPDQVFADLQLMEGAALDVFQEARS